MFTEEQKTEARVYFAGLAMKAALEQLLGKQLFSSQEEVLSFHKEAARFAWRSADVMLAEVDAKAGNDGKAMAALDRLVAIAGKEASKLRAMASEAVSDAATNDTPGITAQAKFQAGELNSRATRIEADIITVSEHFN